MQQAHIHEEMGIAIGHVDDADAMEAVCATLAALHGDAYAFRVTRWQGHTELSGAAGRVRHLFVMRADGARIELVAGQRVRGVPPDGPFRQVEEHWAEVTAATTGELWPGDVVCVDRSVTVLGAATCFEVETEVTDYPRPVAAFLRYLGDRPGGCAAYPGAFRREALPPVRTDGHGDRRGVNRVNEHTLDMRFDRVPQPQPHHHGPVATGDGRAVNHSETALVLPRAIYGLPPVDGAVDGEEVGRVVLYLNPAQDSTTTEIVAVRPGSVVVTPAAHEDAGGVAGHCFENAFAMLVAIPGFVSPHNAIDGTNRGA